MRRATSACPCLDEAAQLPVCIAGDYVRKEAQDVPVQPVSNNNPGAAEQINPASQTTLCQPISDNAKRKVQRAKRTQAPAAEASQQAFDLIRYR